MLAELGRYRDAAADLRIFLTRNPEPTDRCDLEAKITLYEARASAA